MKSARAVGFFVVTLSTFVFGQESAASRPAPVIKLPVAPIAKPFNDNDAILVMVFRPPPSADAATRLASKEEEWRITLGARSYAFTKAGIDSLRESLERLGRSKASKTAPFISERALLIYADADAPYGYVQKIMEASAGARIYRISIAAVAVEGGPRCAFDSWLPRDVGGSRPAAGGVAESDVDEIRVIMSWNTAANRLERLFGVRVVPPTADGNQLLEKLIRESREENQKLSKPEVPLILDVGPHVPWHYVVDVMSMGHRAQVMKIQFGFGSSLEK